MDAPNPVDSAIKGTAAPSMEKAALAASSTSGVVPDFDPLVAHANPLQDYLLAKQADDILNDPSVGISKPGLTDPLHNTPSSPSMIYLNLLILEASLRAQYLELRARRRHHTFFLALLSLWTVGFGYALFFAPREDGRGVGGSVYWMVEVTEKVCFMGGVITAILVWATGIWDRGVKWPRRWLGLSNRGLRGFNCKLVVIGRPWWMEILAATGFFLTYGLFSETAGSSYRYVDRAISREVEKEMDLAGKEHQTLPVVAEDEERSVHGHGHEEDLAPGGDHVKLLLLAKPFSPAFRENWELYRETYWIRENERRALIRAKLKKRDTKMAKEAKPWGWWLPWAKPSPLPQMPERLHHHTTEKGHHQRLSVVGLEHKRSSSGSLRRGSTSGRSSSRTPTPTHDGGEEAPGLKRTASNASDKRRKKPAAVAGGKTGKRPGVDSRSVTPEIPSRLGRGSVIGDSPGRRKTASSDA